MPAIQPASVLLMPQTAMKVGVSAAKAKFGSSVPTSPIDIANTSGRPRSAIMGPVSVIPAKAGIQGNQLACGPGFPLSRE